MGPLKGVRIVEFSGIGPAPFAAMLLADMGAEIIRIERQGGNAVAAMAPSLYRGRGAITLDLKKPENVETALKLIERADALIEGFRPGVMERLGLGPDICFERNPTLSYGRMTGWGQSGPLAEAAGHDINYIAITGALHAIGEAERPVPPLNLLGDFAGGSLYLAFGLVCSVLEARKSGKGQVVDAAICDGVMHLMSMFHDSVSKGSWLDARGRNMIDGGSHFYNVYETKDGKFISIGSLEPQFYRQLLERTGLLGETGFAAQHDRSAWPALKARLAAVFKTKTRDEWDAVMLGSDVCYAPVLSIAEAPNHPHNVARAAFTEMEGAAYAAPAPRFSRTIAKAEGAPPVIDNVSLLSGWGVSAREIERLSAVGAFGGLSGSP